MGLDEFEGQIQDYDGTNHKAGCEHCCQNYFDLNAVGLLVLVAVAAKRQHTVRQERLQVSFTILKISYVVLRFYQRSFTKGLGWSVISIAVGEGRISCPETIESLKLGLGDCLDFSNHKPIYALSARRSSERARVVIEVSKVDLTQQVS